ncbi:tetratricopeptide repeat protein [Clostridium sp.]|uniref:tetratricopeptide repeat protein n=1 Tax=Clostridium sp. TaxID=1506 RepID=UPI001A3AAC39|nr:tetratricopeptide repeat protein [Clostridium sp.]MBK5242979.1 tetratricopeptide repeat protein [Clostridium sp.]
MKLIKIPNTLLYILIFIILIVVIIGETPSLKDKTAHIIKNIKFKTITKNMETKKFDNITYYYLNKGDETYINTIKEYIKEGEVKIAPLLGQTTMYPFNIIIFTTSESFGKAFNVNPEESRAVTIFDSLYVPNDNINSYVLVHEYTHYKMSSFCKDKDIQEFKIPSWFQEGVAEYTSSSLLPEVFKNPKIQQIKDFRKLDKNTQMWKYNESYMQSYIAVKKLIELKGQNSIQQILINTKSMTFYNAFEKVVGLNIDDFQKLLENQLESIDSVNALLKSGLTYYQQKKFLKAKEIFLEATKKYPDNNLTWVRLSMCYIELGDFDGALKSREKSVSIEGANSSSYFEYSKLLISTDLDKAVSMAEKSAQLAKKDSDNPKFTMNYFLFIKDINDNINLDKPFTQYVTLIKTDYLYVPMIKIDIINKVLAKYPDKNDNQKEQLIKLKSDLENQK